MANSADPDQLTSTDLDLHMQFVTIGYIRVQQD